MKKKFLLIFIIGIFLISFTSAGVYIEYNTTRPVVVMNLEADNGTYQLADNTNYYFQCFVGGYTYNGDPVGPASEEINFTTNSTHRWVNFTNIRDLCAGYNFTGYIYKGVHCRWSANQSFLDWGGEGYMPWAFTNNETSTGHTQWLSQYGNPGNYWAPEMKCSNNKLFVLLNSNVVRTGNNNYASWYVHHPEIAVQLSVRNNLSQSFNISKGMMNIFINDTSNTWNDITTALNNYGDNDLYLLSRDSLTILGAMSGNGNLTLESKTLTTILADTNTDVTNLKFAKGSKYQVEAGAAHWVALMGSYNDSSVTIIGGTPILDAVGYAKNLNYYTTSASTHYGNWSGWNFNGGQHASRYFNENLRGYNGNFYGVIEAHTPNSVTSLNKTIHFENLTFYNNNILTYDINVDLSYVDNCYNNTWIIYDMKNVIFDRPNKRPIITYTAALPSAMCGLTMNYTFHGDNTFKIISTNGSSIENANITLLNEFNEYTKLTNSEGISVIDATYYYIFWNYSVPTFRSSTIEQGLYNLSITKDGYKDYNSVINISEPISWTISLSPLEDPSPASLILDKIISLNEITNETISYNITLRLTNKGGSNSTNTNLTDLDSEDSPYTLENISNNSFIKISYLKNFTRNSTTYQVSLSQAQSIGIDSSTFNITTANSTLIDLIIPSTSTGQQLTLIKNAYYNSENSTHVNYTLSVEVVNSGGEDLTNITLLDNDLNLNEIINLNRTQSSNFSNFTIIEKAASNTNKLFDKSSATVNTLVYQSNQIQVRIPGYGGPADAIVYSSSSVTSSTEFNITITVKNMNPDIGQDFTIDYWITNENETLNYSSGQQTIYVSYSGESNLTTNILSPTIDGNYKIKALVTWIGGTASAYNSFLVSTPAPPSSHSSSSKKSLLTTNAISPIQEVICNIPYIRYGLECCLDKNNNSICDTHEIIDTPKENISQEIKQTPQEEIINNFENPLFKKIKESLTKIKKTYLIIILAITLILIFFIIFIIKNIKNKKQIKVKYANSKEFKKLEGISAYTQIGKKIGNVKGIYINENSKEIYGWAIELDKDIAKSMNLNERNFFIKHGDYKII